MYRPWGFDTPYGTADRLYGLPTPPTTSALWEISVDWDGDGDFSDEDNIADLCFSLHTRRGRENFLNYTEEGKADGFERLMVGKATIIADNSDGRFDPYNTASPLYPNVLPGRYVRIRVTDGSAGSTYSVFAGKIRDIRTIRNKRQAQVRIECEDGMRLLAGTDASIPITTTTTKSSAVELVLDNIGWPTLWGRNIETSYDDLDYFWTNNRAITEISRLADAELGNFFVAADGKATFYARGHTSTATLTLTQADILADIDLPQPWDTVRNQVRVYAHPRIQQATSTLWTLQDVPLIGAGNSLTLWAQYMYGANFVPALNAEIASTDYTMNAQADGGGADLTTDFSVTLTDFGETGKVVVTNNGASGGYVTLLQIRGDAIDAPDSLYSETESTSSQLLYGKLLFTLDNNWLQSSSRAQDFSTWLGSYMDTPKKYWRVKMEGQTASQFSIDLFDKINQSVLELGSTATDYYVSYIEHEWLKETGQATRTTWYYEPLVYDSVGYWIFTATMEVTTNFAL